MEIWVEEIKKSLDDCQVIMEGQEGSCSRICKVISSSFKDLGLLDRHRLVKKILAKHFDGDLHALSLQTYTAEEYNHGS